MSDLARERIGAAPTLRVWPMAVVLVALAVVGMELFWRWRGFTPSVVDDGELWAIHRRSVKSDAVVLLGTSRMLMGFSLPACRAHFRNRQVVQLAANGNSPLEVIEDLANDPDFHGLILCDAPEWSFLRSFRDGLPPYPGMRERIRLARSPNLNRDLNRQLATWLQHRLVFIHPNLKLTAILSTALRWKHGPEPNFVRILPDRSELGDFRKARLDRYATPGRPIGLKEEDETPADLWLEQALEVRPWIAALQAKRANLVFIRFPSKAWLWDLEEQMYPKAHYWDALAAKLPVPTLHFLDDPELAAFPCPDNSHLDAQDAPAFTRRVLEILDGR